MERSRAATRGGTVAIIVAAVTLVATTACTVADPPPPPVGLGARGACTSTSRDVSDSDRSPQTITVFEPGGDGATPLVGGRCSDPTRPVVVVVHGMFAASTVLYQDIIDHFVSVGNVVVFATYLTDPYDLVGSYQDEDQALVTAAAGTPRADLSLLSFVGHSLGAGALPYLAQQAVGRGWGGKGLSLLLLAPFAAGGVGTGPIELPGHARVVVEAYDDDTWVDARIGIEIFHALAVGPDHKHHVTVRSQTHGDATLHAQHLSANSLIAPNDAIKFYGIYRIGDALQSCALTGRYCDVDLSYMGTWNDDTAVTPAVVTDRPIDVGPLATSAGIFGLDGECPSSLNPRAANCGPSSR